MMETFKLNGYKRELLVNYVRNNMTIVAFEYYDYLKNKK